MPEKKKRGQKAKPEASTEFDRAPRQKPSDRDAVKAAEQVKHVPTKHGALK